MNDNDTFSINQLKSILDNSPVAVIVSALDNRELLYANKAAAAMIVPECRGHRTSCYQAFGHSKPCPTCPAGQAGGERPVCRELYVPEYGRTYQFSGKDADWAGRPAHIEYISDISEQKRLEREQDHLINSIPGGIASYEVKDGRFIPLYFSDGVMAISGHTREEFNQLIRHDALDIIYEADRERVLTAAVKSVKSGSILDVSYRMRHKNGELIWIHLNGRRIGPLSDSTTFYAVFTGMSPESRLFQKITNETADGIYVIAKDTHELLYINETDGMFTRKSDCLGRPCFTALRERNTPCEFCNLQKGIMDGEEYEKTADGTGRIYHAHYRETNWNGIPAYVKYMRDITEEVRTRQEKERLDLYFRSIVEQFPGGISMLLYHPDGTMKLEFISKGFAAMTRRTVEEAMDLYDKDIFAGIHPDDIKRNLPKLQHFLESGEGACELIARMKPKDGDYFWVNSTLSMLSANDGVRRIYIVYTDISRNVEEKERLRRRYEEQLLEHYHKPGTNELILGHSNISQNRVVEMRDSTDSALLKRFGSKRDGFFRGLADLIIKEEDRKAFLDRFLNEPLLEVFTRNRTEQVMSCLAQLPEDPCGRYVQFKVNLLEGPEAGEVIGILTVTDITEEIISERIFRQLSVTTHDYVVDVDLLHDSYTLLACRKGASCVPPPHGCHSERVAYMAESVVMAKDSRQYIKALSAERIRRSLKEGPYTFTCSMEENGRIRIKSKTVASVEPLLDRYCVVCTDITDSVREQQGLLNMMAYTFELMGFLERTSGRFTMYTRQMVLENLPPHSMMDYGKTIEMLIDSVVEEEEPGALRAQLSMESILKRLEEEPSGFDFVAACQEETGIRYKQFNLLWGDRNHSTVCVVRADVTDMIATERSAKKKLEEALALAEEASQAKSNFLSAMSHDIRTPMNAIIGMTTLAAAHSDDRDRVEDCLKKISVSSRHLLSLINDVLDMSRIEHSGLTLNHMELLLPDLLEQLATILVPQAREQGINLYFHTDQVSHTCFYGDTLRINQILINLLGNAVKFTPAGGKVDFMVEEIAPVKTRDHIRYRFTVRDTGIGMTEEFQSHIFEPFTREQTVRFHEGTGLGLSITKELVDLMGGTITVESRLNSGSCFTVELEFKAAEDSRQFRTERNEISAAKRENVFAGRHFLVAEDNEINAEILCELLRMQGASCDLRTDGTQAVEAFRAAVPGQYDAILMDIRMPEMDGYEATRVIRGMGHGDSGTIPVIAMTANAFTEDVQAALKAGMTAHVAKPIDMDLLRSALSKAFWPEKWRN